MVIQETLQEDTEHLQIDMTLTKGLVETQEHLTSFPMATEFTTLLVMSENMS